MSFAQFIFFAEPHERSNLFLEPILVAVISRSRDAMCRVYS